MSQERILTCVYCGHEYPQGTPAWGNEVLTEHIKVCEKHPMRALEEENKHLKAVITNACANLYPILQDNPFEDDVREVYNDLLNSRE